MARFEDNFWGDKHNGYDVLYQNMKYGEQASKDWMDFLRQYAACEEQYCKSLQRLAKSAGAYVVVGSFASVWPVVKASFDKLAQAHQDMSKQWQEMGKEILKYTDGQVKKHKAVKDSQTSTVEVVQTMQHITVTLQKTKEAYQAKFAEYCKARKEHASVKKADKMDADFKKAAEEYRAAVGKYNAAREEFQSKMTDSCKAFQEQEEAHLTQMLTFLKTFAGAHEQKHVEIGEMYYEFHSNVEQLSVAKLLTELVDAKRTGADRPPAAEFEEVDMSLLPKLAAPPEDADGGKKDDSAGQGGGGSAASATMHIIIPGILKKRRGKKQKQQQQGGGAASQRGSANGESKDGDSLDTQSKSSLPEVDDDGYTIRKDETPKEEDSWDSDTDSGSDGERSRTKIKVEIKPIDRGSNSGGGSEYRLPPRLSSTQLATAVGGGGVSLSHDRSSSRSKLGDGGGSGFAGGGGGGGGSSLGTGSESSSSASAWDLLGLDLQVGGLSGASMPATPDSERLSAASLSGSAGGGGGTAAATVTVTAATAPGSADSSSTEDREVERLWQSPLERRPAAAVMAAAHEQAAAASAAAAIIQGLPRPPSRRDITGTLSSRQAAAPGRSSPLLLQQRGGGGGAADLLGGNVTAPPLQQPPFSSSRGPSPMCATSSEPLPIAVALTEVMDAYVKTATAGSQQRAASTTRTTGDVMISLPAAVVVKLLAEGGGGGGSSPPPLVFKLVNVGKLEQWQVNERLVAPSALERDDGCATYAFSMAALVDYLRAKLAENRAAPYFNVDVAKYALKPADADALPLRARAFWRRDATRIDFALDYAYNPAGLAKPLPLGNVSFLVPVDGDVTGMQAMPEAQWSPEHRKALWKLDELQQSGASSSGTVRARFELAGGSGAPPATAEVAAAAAPVAVQFACDGTTVSGVDFELVGSGYRLSFAKRRMCTGKYLVDGDIRLASAEVRYV